MSLKAVLNDRDSILHHTNDHSTWHLVAAKPDEVDPIQVKST